MPESPKVGVFIASYNHAQFLPECLDSILAQTYQNFEIVIVDDGSTDKSHEILTDYQRCFPEKIYYFWHSGHRNKGISASCNLAISKARGEYLAWIGSDDVWYPDKLMQQVAFLDNNPRFGLVYSHAHFINETGDILPGLAGVDVTHDSNPLGRMIQYCHPPAMTVVIRRDCLEDVGLFDENLIYSDWDLMIRVFARWEAGFLNSALAKYRIHNRNVSKGIDPKKDLERILALYLAVRIKSTNIGGTLLIPRNQALLSLQFAFHYFYAGKIEEAIINLSRAFEEDPSLIDETSYFNDWLNSWKPDFYNTSHGHFGFWVIAHLSPMVPATFRSELAKLQLSNPETKSFFIRRGIQRGQSQIEPVDLTNMFDDCPGEIPISRSWKEGVLKEVYPALLFDSYKIGNLRKTQYYWRKTVQLDPFRLRNRGVWSIGLKALLGGMTQ